MPRADPVERRLQQQAISRAKTKLANRHRDEFNRMARDIFNQLLREHGLPEER